MIGVAVQTEPSHYAVLVGVVRELLKGRARDCRFQCVARPAMAGACGIYVVVALAPLSDVGRTEIMKATGCYQVVDLVWDEHDVPELAAIVVSVIERFGSH